MDELDRRILAAGANNPSQLHWCDRRSAAYLCDMPGSRLDVTGRVRQLGNQRLLAFVGEELSTTRPGRERLSGV